jgi:ATP-dependent DNA helicase RecQ
MAIMTPLEILKNQFGYSSFRLEQEAIINNVLQRKDTFALMPTGGGKSVCYQIPALIFDGVTVVISPLIALMKDQVDALRLNGIKAAFLNSTQNPNEQNEILEKVRLKQLKLLYLAPESTFFRRIASFPVSLIAIDEAHCISHWGHDFRPEYLMLSQLKRALPHVPMIALTATADHLTRQDIVDKLALQNPVTFISSFNRPNIRYTVEPKKRSFEELVHFLWKRRDESGIVYCLSRASTERIANDLIDQGFSARAYHAGIEKELRSKHQEMFLRDEVKIIVATIAFGMGIDKSNVRYVVHMDLPKNIESYYQETGRAGRDGLESEVLLFYSYGDVAKMKKFVEIENNPERTDIQLKKLEQMGRYGELVTCRRKYLLNYFNEAAPAYCGNCDVCLTRMQHRDGTIQAQKVLSAVSRLQQQFGAGYVIDFLKGSKSAKIHEEHKQLKTFGTGSDTSKELWSGVIQDLVAQGYLTKSKGQYPILLLTDKSANVLKGTESVMITTAKEKIEIQEQTIQYETALFQQLKDVRLQLAREENVPAYIVLSDASLMEIAAYLPHDKDEFRRISGFGSIKIEKYGKYFWDVVAGYCTKHQLKSRMHLKAVKRLRERTEQDNETKQQTLALFKKGLTIEKISALRQLSRGTIESHLTFYVESGKLKIDEVMTPEKIALIRDAVEKLGSGILTPIKESLGEGFSFNEIRMVIADLEFTRENLASAEPVDALSQ